MSSRDRKLHLRLREKSHHNRSPVWQTSISKRRIRLSLTLDYPGADFHRVAITLQYLQKACIDGKDYQWLITPSTLMHCPKISWRTKNYLMWKTVFTKWPCKLNNLHQNEALIRQLKWTTTLLWCGSGKLHCVRNQIAKGDQIWATTTTPKRRGPMSTLKILAPKVPIKKPKERC